ncbi:MAG: exodeoxyribonuclease V subunit gamma [Syntrophobacter sp.]
MNPIRLFTGNRLDILAEELARVISTPLDSPFDPEIILVHSKGMERWLSMRIAAHLGICANCRFPFPNAFIHDAFRNMIDDLPDSSIYDPRFCTWKIMEILPDHLEKQGFEPLRSYLEGTGRTLKLLQLSKRIAETFDQYVVYRPELIESWESGVEQHWQAVLWREIVRGHEGQHRAALGKRLLDALRHAAFAEQKLPRRLSVFGISYLPPFHLHILAGLSRFTEVNIFSLNPSMEYWGDIVSTREIGRIQGRKTPRMSLEDLYLENGNPLLASMGVMGRDFFDLMTSLDCQEIPIFEDPGNSSLLSSMQSDILNLRNTNGPAGDRVALAEGDDSIQIHSCHSPMREIEVLYDHILGMFESDPELMPRDILVMTPDIESYTPFIEAVFGSPENDLKKVPYSIADRSMRSESRIIDTFLGLLNLGSERITAPNVLSILEAPSVHSSFGITSPDVDLITGWVSEVRIRWGIDLEDRLKWCPGSFPENTWSAGIERLLLGYAMPGRDKRLFGEILPYDNIEGSEAAVLGNFLAFIDELFHFLTAAESPRPLSDWSDFLSDMVTRFFALDEDSKFEMQALRLAIAELRKIEEVSGFREPVDLELIRWHLGKSLGQGGFGLGFMTGGVTFCSMLPMRSIPFKVICLIGMDENAFPRQTKPTEFDLMAKTPRPGDRSIRNEDRYLFLETLLSAGDKLYISYTGQNCRDNSVIPSSVLVSELMDVINRGYAPAPSSNGAADPDGIIAPRGVTQAARDWFLTSHPLQPFNPAYFGNDGRLFSYSEERLATARCLVAEKREAPVLIQERLTKPEDAFRTVTLADLCRFFADPARFLLNRRLGVYLNEDRGRLDDAESFQLEPLERYSLGKTLTEAAMSGAQPMELLPMVRASGLLPHGVPGESAFTTVDSGAKRFADRTAPYIGSQELEPLHVDLPFGDFRVTGTIGSIQPERMVRYRFAVIRAKDHLDLWITHLVLNLRGGPGYPKVSMLAGLDGDREWLGISYSPVADGEKVLRELLALYWEGLTQPLHFFPQISLKYARMVLKKDKPRNDVLRAAKNDWIGNDYHPGESQAPYNQLCHGSCIPMDADFERIAESVFSPLLDHLREV